MAKVTSGKVDTFSNPVDPASKSPVVDRVPQASGGPHNNPPIRAGQTVTNEADLHPKSSVISDEEAAAQENEKQQDKDREEREAAEPKVKKSDLPEHLKKEDFDIVFQVGHGKVPAEFSSVALIEHDDERGQYYRVPTSIGIQYAYDGSWISRGSNGWHVGISDPRTKG